MSGSVGGRDRLRGLGEEGLLRRIRAAASQQHPALIRGIGDDAAVFAGPTRTLVTTDLLAEGVHFRRDRTLPRLLGRKAIAVNLSDIAAMAGTPLFAFLCLAAPPDFPVAEMDEIVAGIIERCDGAGVILAGGDITQAQSLILSVTVVGSAMVPGPVYRSGARPDDGIYVTGELGGSALGLHRLLTMDRQLTAESLAADPLAGAIRRQLDPPARIEAGLALAGRARAMMDLSDGLLTDLPRLLIESGGLGAVIETAALPLDPDLAGQPPDLALSCAAAGGEDYELLCVGSTEAMPAFAAGLRLTRIGTVRPEPGIQLVGPAGEPVDLPPPRFEHFRPGAE